jgi:Ca2+-binding EF-hand superfamily protein
LLFVNKRLLLKKDKSGSIDFVEFLVALSVSSQKDIHKKLRLAFRYYDSNSNGKIDRKEMTQMITAIYELKGNFDLSGKIRSYIYGVSIKSF